MVLIEGKVVSHVHRFLFTFPSGFFVADEIVYVVIIYSLANLLLSSNSESILRVSRNKKFEKK